MKERRQWDRNYYEKNRNKILENAKKSYTENRENIRIDRKRTCSTCLKILSSSSVLKRHTQTFHTNVP